MVHSIQSAILVLATALAAVPNAHVQAVSLSNAPFVPRPNNGVTTLDSNNMVVGRPIDPNSYALPNTNHSSTTSTENREAIDNKEPTDGTTTGSDLNYLQTHYGITFEMNADTINSQWKSAQPKQMPWPGSYWPAYRDGINDAASGTQSAADKYALANGLDPVQFKDKISAASGIDANNNYPSCTSDAQCDGQSKCAKRAGKSSGYCILEWVGICHAWAPAALQEPEPKCPVTIAGQTFDVQDIKALLTQAYDGAGIGVVYGGVRFDGGDNDAKDQYGRLIDRTHRDINPALFHVALANILGRLGQAFLIDADPSAAVWNQPIRSYSFSDPIEKHPDVAASQYLSTTSYTVFNPSAKSVYYIKNEFTYINEGYENRPLSTPGVVDKYTEPRTYEYLLELDENRNIIGGEWVGDSRSQHPDFMWVPLGRPADGLVTDIGISWDFVNHLNSLSQSLTC